MNVECKMSDNLSSQCFNVGRDIARSQQDQNVHRRAIADCQQHINADEERLREIESNLFSLRASQIAAESVPRAAGRTAQLVGGASSNAIRLARKIDDLERERDRISNTVSACTRRLNTARGDLFHVENHLERLTSEFARLGCSASTIPF